MKSEGQLCSKKTKYNLVVEEDDKRMDQVGGVCEPGEGTERGQRQHLEDDHHLKVLHTTVNITQSTGPP